MEKRTSLEEVDRALEYQDRLDERLARIERALEINQDNFQVEDSKE